jgi:hypothetical protein
MALKIPRITALQPLVLDDNHRVMMELVVEDLPTPPNVMLTLPDAVPSPPPKSDPDAPSPYPDIELSILDSRRQQVRSLLIIEHKERATNLTLHIPAPDPTEQYTARAAMTHQHQIVQVVEIPFRLHPMDSA